MTAETFNKLLDELDGNSLETLKKKNAKYASSDDCLHNFDSGAEIMGSTPAQCAWGYMTKHLVALRDKVEKNDFRDRDDLLEKCQDIINYIRFIWLIGNEEMSKYTGGNPVNKAKVTNSSEAADIRLPMHCDYYMSGECWGTKEREPCNYTPGKECHRRPSIGGSAGV